jgi:GNAT superfamily N-acetyltransferase
VTTERLTATRTYLEITRRDALRSARLSDASLRIDRVDDCPPELWRSLYTEVGRQYRWTDRLPWTDDDIRAYLKDPAVSVWVLTLEYEPAGYFELRRNGTDIEIAYFGLLPAFTGRGLGGHLLTEAVEQAWAAGATRVWLHTSTLDHPAALPNYLKRGFTIFKTEEYSL